MGTTLKHLLLCTAIGMAVAVGAWLVWWFAALALATDTPDLITFLPAFFIGIAASVLAAIAMTLLHRRDAAALRQQLAMKSAPPQIGPAWSLAILNDVHSLQERSRHQVARARKRRRHPLDPKPCLARATPALRWQAVTRSLARLLQAEPANYVGRPVFHRLHPEDVNALDQAFNDARSHQSVQSVLCRFLAADASGTHAKGNGSAKSDTKVLPALAPKSLVYVRIEIWAKRDRAKRVKHFVCRFVDLSAVVVQQETELHLARRELRKIKKRMRSAEGDLHRLKLSYRELYQNAPVMYFSVNTEGRLVTFNDTLLETLGYDRHELQDRDYTMLLPNDTLKSYVTIAESMPPRDGEREVQWRKKHGTPMDVWLHAVPVYDEFGKFVRCRCAALDMSEKNRLANELRSRGSELERTNHRLRTINSELEAFTHVVSHDLKEPLRTLQAYSHLLAEEHAGRLGADGFQYINHLIRASRRLGSLIDDLLQLGHAGRITREPQVFNLNQIVATVRQDLVGLFQRKEASVLTEGSLPEVAGDPVRITQLLTNLVANGLKYNQHESPTIVIGATACAEDPARVTVFVRDNGIGIDPAFHQQIFNIFRRLHKAEQYEGTGVGLAICKKIVEGHGGRIWVESELGRGAVFFFTLPRPPQNGKAPAPTVKSEESPSSVRSRKLLVQSEPADAPNIVLVEDQPDVGMIIQKLAKRDGLTVSWFPTAEEGWEHLRVHGADLILLDVNLPGISGVDLCRRLRGHPMLAETPVAMFTPDREPEKLDELRAAGADFFLTKDLLCEPLHWQMKIKELLAQIREPAR
ncbi:MAG TPA: ATP-binding protein [Gemmataceae bacterium]|nr:ATP-binding protein [Gemmataceae bacterium]